MKARQIIITTISFIAILGLTGCLTEHEESSTNIHPYTSGNEDPPTLKGVRDLPEGIEEELNNLGINIGILPIVDHETGDIFVFKGRDVEIGDIEFPISTSSIESITGITVFRYVGSKCFGIGLNGRFVGGCSHIQ